MYAEVEEDQGQHTLLNPDGPKFTSALTQRALIVWNQLGRKNKFLDVYRFYKAIEKSESALSTRSRDASQKLDLDLINTEPPTSKYLNELFPNLYPDKRDYIVPKELKDSQYIASHAPNVPKTLPVQAKVTGNVTPTSGIIAGNGSISANEDVISVSQMMRDYCIAHKTTLKEFILEFKAYADVYGLNATVSNVTFYMQYKTALEQRGLPLNGIVNQNIPAQVPKKVTQNAQTIDVMEIFDNAVKNINTYGHSNYYQNLITAYNYNSVEAPHYNNGNGIPVQNINNNAEVLNEHNRLKNEMIVKQNGNADYSAILKRNIVNTDERNGSSVTCTKLELPIEVPNITNENAKNAFNTAGDYANNGKLEAKNSVADTISRNENQMTTAQSINHNADLSYGDMTDVWNQLSALTINPSTSTNLNNSIQNSEIKSPERTPEKTKTADHSDLFSTTAAAKVKNIISKSEKAAKAANNQGNSSNGITSSPKKVVNNNVAVKKSLDDSNHSSFYLDAESSFSCPDSSLEEFERFKERSSTTYQER